MWIRFTSQQFRTLTNFVVLEHTPEKSKLFMHWFNQAEKHARTRVDVPLPAIGWKQLSVRLFNRCFNQRGYRNSEAPPTLSKALQRIQSGVNFIETHPAYRGAGMAGWHKTIIPVWLKLATDQHGDWSPYPLQFAPFSILVPEHLKVGGQKVTTWREGVPPSTGELLEESAHLRFT